MPWLSVIPPIWNVTMIITMKYIYCQSYTDKGINHARSWHNINDNIRRQAQWYNNFDKGGMKWRLVWKNSYQGFAFAVLYEWVCCIGTRYMGALSIEKIRHNCKKIEDTAAGFILHKQNDQIVLYQPPFQIRLLNLWNRLIISMSPRKYVVSKKNVMKRKLRIVHI